MQSRKEPKTVATLEANLKKAKARNCELELALLHMARLYTRLAEDWLPEHLDAIELDAAKAKSMYEELHRTAEHIHRVYDGVQGESLR